MCAFQSVGEHHVILSRGRLRLIGKSKEGRGVRGLVLTHDACLPVAVSCGWIDESRWLYWNIQRLLRILKMVLHAVDQIGRLAGVVAVSTEARVLQHLSWRQACLGMQHCAAFEWASSLIMAHRVCSHGADATLTAVLLLLKEIDVDALTLEKLHLKYGQIQLVDLLRRHGYLGF